MHRLFVAVVCAGALVATGACGKSEPEKRAEEAQKAAEQMGKGAEGMAKGIEEMAKSLQAVASSATGDASQKPVEPVSFRDLQAAFPEIPGWTRGKPTGEKMTSPVSYSEASVTYTNGDAEIRAKLTDSAFNQMLTMAFAMMTATGYEKETDEGYEKSTKVGDYPGWEKRNDKQKSGELGTLVNKRFVLELEGSNLPDNKPLYQVAQAADLKRLGSLK